MFVIPPHLANQYPGLFEPLIESVLPGWILDHLHVEVLTLEPGTATFRLAANPGLFRRFPPPVTVSHLSGQVVMALADTLLVFPALAMLGEHREMATLNLSTEFLRPIHDGDITITAQVLKLGRTAIRGRVDIHDEAGKLCATSMVCYVYVSPQNPSQTGDAS
ncbi:MAG: PaaI family thioesterase [Cardiobacteriaceae bacterium]|nr:PaaI family thioesterase [Cardiobacteriaceae bacterium]